VNHWLHECGYLCVKRRTDLEAGVKSVLSRLKSIPWIRRLKRAVLPKSWNSFALRSMAVSNAIEWSQTQAFFGLDGGVRINLEGREPEGIVPLRDYDCLREELRDRLLNLTDPETKRCPISEAFFREEIYQGPFVDQAPDLILEPERDNDAAIYNFLLDGSLGGDLPELFDTSAPYAANHALDGILIASGAGVAQGQQIAGSEITDLAPTILAYLGVSVPKAMDGNVLQGLFSSGDMPVPRYVEDSEPVASAGTKGFGLEEQKRIEERLKKLGYLD
jgi:predicted AlkP superfamily phosphohydrolase/phosphomutase